MDWSVRQSMDPVCRGVHGPGVSVFRSPLDSKTVHACFETSGCWRRPVVIAALSLCQLYGNAERHL